MFIFLSKFLPIFFYPLGLACWLVIAALFVGRKPTLRRSRWQKSLLLAAVLILWISSNRWVATGLARSLEWRYLPPEPMPSAQAIVLLGGGTEADIFPRPSVEVNAAGDRVLYAAELYHQGKAPYIVVTGKRIEWLGGGGSPTQEMAELLVRLGVPAEAIWQESDSLNTYEDALYTRKILEEKGIRRIILVTSASHLPRSVPLFEHQGFEVIPAPTDYTVTQAEWDELGNTSLAELLTGLFPSAENLSTTTRILKEYLGMAIYSLRGW